MLPRDMTSVKLAVLCVCLCFQTVLCQFGFYPQRHQRRFQPLFGMNQNFFPNPGRITNTLSALLQLQQENPYSNPAYIYPFQNRPITNPNQNPYNVRFPNQGGQGTSPNVEQPNSEYPGFNNNPGITNTPSFNDNQNVNGGLTSGQQNGPVFGTDVPNFGNGGTDTLTSGQQIGPVFGEGTNNGYVGNLVSGQQNGPAFSTDAPNFDNRGPNTLVSGQQTGPVFGQDIPNSDNGGSTLVSGQQNGPAFGTEAPNNGNDGTNTLVSGQQNGQGSENAGNLISGQQNEPVFSTEAPKFENGGTGSLVSGQQNGPAFENTGGLISGKQNGPAFGTEAPPTENGGTLISGTHSGPVYSPDSPVPGFSSRNDFNQGVFKETCSNVEGGIGRCIIITSCPPYIKLLQAKTSASAVQQLRAAHCGFEGDSPKVCCPIPAPPEPATTKSPSGKSIPESDFITAFPEPPVCGLSNASFSRVVGGVNAKLGDFPWMALLGYQGRRGASTRWLCGGSLISHHHVLTAAHCIHNHEEDLYLVRLGELDLEREDEGATPIDVLIKTKIKHEKYSPESFTNDIGILVLERDVDFTDLIRPICIPTRADLRANNFVDYNPLIAGWGDTEFRGPSASHLQVLQLPVLDNSYCQKAYTRYKAQVIDERVMCAGFKKGGKDACQGDSGGPLMQPDYNPTTLTTYFYQTGVVSFGRKCAEAGFPGIYTRVTYFVPWLQKNVLGLAE